jgi:acyl homoserine lactone synthase
MMYLISQSHRGNECNRDLEELLRLRYRVFKERLNWDVECQDGMERDRYDDLNPVHLAYRGESGAIEGCIRLLPTTGPNMLRDVLPSLLNGTPAPCSPRIWESSRFSLDTQSTDKSKVRLTRATHELFAGMIEFGLMWGLSHIVTVADLRVERILGTVRIRTGGSST